MGRLGFSLLLKYLQWKGRFPRGRSELPEGSVEFVAKQVGVAASELGFYNWDGRQIKRHRVQLRGFLGCRKCTVADAEKVTVWLAEHVCQSERRAERVREQLLAHLRAEPAAGTPRADQADLAGGVRREYKAKGLTFRQHKQRVFKASYTHHYRRGLIGLPRTGRLSCRK